MKGARILSNSLSGTRPPKTSASVPRLYRAVERPDTHFIAFGRRGTASRTQFLVTG